LVSIPVDTDILLRSFLPDDADHLFNVVNESRTHLAPWLAWVHNTTNPTHSKQFIETSIHKAEMQEELVLGIFCNDQIIGCLGMHNWDRTTRRAQIGYWLSKEYVGKGIINNSLSLFIDFLFSKLELNKLEIHFAAANQKSARVAENAGFRIEGIIRKATFRNGMADDLVMTGLLREEWNNYKKNKEA